MKGIVKFFDMVKCFGFILGEDGKEHYVSAFWKSMNLRKGEHVIFELKPSPDGRSDRAVDIEREPTIKAKPQSTEADRYDETIGEELEQFNAANGRKARYTAEA